MNRTLPRSIVDQIYDPGRSGKLSFDMCKGRRLKDKPKETGLFRLFVLKEDNEPVGQATSPPVKAGLILVLMQMYC